MTIQRREGKQIMYLIALCDDENAELDKTEQILRNYEKEHSEIEFVVERFLNADSLLNKVKQKNYRPDFIFMDIYMSEKSGMDAARELRAMGNNGKIIFLTTSREYALDAFGVEASQYLVKPITEQTLFLVLDRCLKDINEMNRKYLLLRVEGRIQRVAVSDIVCCEAQRKLQYLYLSNDTQFGLRRTMTEIYEMLIGYRQFVRVGVAYIVNLEHVESLSAQEVQMDSGKKIYLPRGSYHPLRERYFNYYCESSEILIK